MMTSILNPSAPVDYYSQGLRKRFHLDGLKVKAARADTTTYADIRYELDEGMYHDRTRKILAADGLPDDVPAGFPRQLEGPLIWSTGDFTDEEYVFHLSKDDIDEIHKALEYFYEQELEGEDVDKDTFPLPRLGPRLEQASLDVYEGRGFAIIRGLDPDMHSVDDYTVIYLGISSYIAERRGKQDQRGSMLMHVMARDKTDQDPKNLDKPFHNDTVCDTLALITRNCSAHGGRSVIASAWKVYNELVKARPDIIHVLAQPNWPFDTYGRAPPYYERACLYYHEEKVILNLSRRLLVGHAPREPRSQGIPGLTEAQAEALDAIHYLAEKHSVRPSMQKGDMRFINNMAILHRREAFVNDESNERHLIRIWLNNEEKCWKLPEPLQLAWARVFDDVERDTHWDIAPIRKDGRILRVAGSCD